MIESRFHRVYDEDRYRCSIGSAILGVVGVTGTMAAIGGPLLTAGIGAGVSAATGNNPLTGALVGGGIGALGAATGLGGDALALGSSVDPFSGAASSAAGSLGTPAVSGGMTDYSGAIGPNQALAGSPGAFSADPSQPSPTSYFGSSSSSPAGGAAANVATKGGPLGGILGGSGGISNTVAALGALGALGAGINKPQVGTYPLPGPSSTAATQGPLFNQPLPTSFGAPRQVQLPQGFNPYTAGFGASPNYFTNNQLQYPQLPAAHGGAIGALGAHAQGGHEFSTRNGQHYVEGDDGGTDDTVPAQLSSGEYVLTANDVAVLGSGNNKAGARKIDQWREALHRDVGGNKFIPKKASDALSRLRPGAA